MIDAAAITLNGVISPIPTPFDGEGDVACDMLIENLHRWNQYDLAGYVVLGSSGEAVYLTAEERLQVWQAARRAIPAEKVFMAGTGCESTRQTVVLSRQAAEAGADAVLILPPHYYSGQMTPDALTGHFETVADHVPIPVVLYNMPRFTQLDMDAETIARIARHPNVIGIKDSGGNVGKLAQMVRAGGDGFQVLAGSASFFFPGLTVGAVGGVLGLANIAPQAAIDLYRLFRSGDWVEAAALQQRLVPVNTAVTSRFGIAGLKAALDILGYYGGPVRSPLRSLDQQEIETLEAILDAGKVL